MPSYIDGAFPRATLYARMRALDSRILCAFIFPVVMIRGLEDKASRQIREARKSSLHEAYGGIESLRLRCQACLEQKPVEQRRSRILLCRSQQAADDRCMVESSLLSTKVCTETLTFHNKPFFSPLWALDADGSLAAPRAIGVSFPCSKRPRRVLSMRKTGCGSKNIIF